MNAGSRQVESGLAVPGVYRSFFRRLLFLCFVLSASPDFQAHQFSESYLAVTLEGRTLGAHSDIAVRDLAHVMTLASGGRISQPRGTVWQPIRRWSTPTFRSISSSRSTTSPVRFLSPIDRFDSLLTVRTRLFVEAVIALSVAVAAGNNLVPFFRGRAWLIAFGFGLVHGFGFATVLQELGLPPGSLARALVGFNIGVEAGQLAIVAVFLPLAYVLRRSWFYRTGLCTVGSAGIVLVAAAWMVDRVFGAGLMPF